MTVKGQLKILDNEIRQNKSDYDLYRKNVKISALSSGKLLEILMRYYKLKYDCQRSVKNS